MAGSIIVFGGQDLATAIKPIGADVVAPVQLARGGLNGNWRRGQSVVSAPHVATRRTSLGFLNSHDDSCLRVVAIIRHTREIKRKYSIFLELGQNRKRRFGRRLV